MAYKFHDSVIFIGELVLQKSWNPCTYSHDKRLSLEDLNVIGVSKYLRLLIIKDIHAIVVGNTFEKTSNGLILNILQKPSNIFFIQYEVDHPFAITYQMIFLNKINQIV